MPALLYAAQCEDMLHSADDTLAPWKDWGARCNSGGYGTTGVGRRV